MTRSYDIQSSDLAAYTLRLADDALVTAQRLCEWSAKAPTLEEDLALANTGLDYLGRARMLYGYAGRLLSTTEDALAYHRDTREFSNALIVELPRGDFAFTMVRQYLVDEFELRYFSVLAQVRDSDLSAIAAKTLKEVKYHHRRSLEWMKRLGLGTAESNRRAQLALDELWGYVHELFALDTLEQALCTAGVGVDRAVLRDGWQAAVANTLAEANLQQPQYDWQVSGGRAGIHTEHLGHLLSEMQSLARAHPGASW